jgi:hypothetical protein
MSTLARPLRASLLEQVVEALVKAWPATALAVFGGLWRWWAARKSRKAKERELIEAMAEQCRASADFDRFQSDYLLGGEVERRLDTFALQEWRRRGSRGMTPREQWDSLKARVKETRSRLHRARGFPESEDNDITPEQLDALRVLTQTMRWKAADKRGNQ